MSNPQDLRYKLIDKIENLIDDDIDAKLDKYLSVAIDSHITNNLWRKLIKALRMNLKETSDDQIEEMFGE